MRFTRMTATTASPEQTALATTHPSRTARDCHAGTAPFVIGIAPFVIPAKAGIHETVRTWCLLLQCKSPEWVESGLYRIAKIARQKNLSYTQ